MRHHRGIAGAMRHIDGGEGLGQRADLVDLDQDRIGDAFSDAARKAGRIGDEKVVTHELAARAQLLRQQLPSLPIVLGHAVLDGDDGVGVRELGEIVDLFGDGARLAFAGIDIGAVLEEFARRRVERERDVRAGLEAGAFDRLDGVIERRLGRRQVGREAALVADVGVEARLLQQGFERMESLRAPAHRLLQGGRAERHDHEFLEVDGVVGVDPAVDDVHHRHRQNARRGSPDIAIERQAGRLGGRLRDSEGHAEDCVRP